MSSRAVNKILHLGAKAQMDFSQPNAQDITAEELEKLENLKKIIERAIEDGIIDGQEIDTIKREIFRSSKGSIDLLRRELDLYNELVVQKLQSDDLEYGV